MVRIDEKTALALCAGARAIENNKRLWGATYVYDIFGDMKEISYHEAAQILRELAAPVIAKEVAGDA